MEDGGVDAIAIAAPPAAQAEIAAAALCHSKSVFAEKPLAIDEPVARALRDDADASGLANMIDFQYPELGVFRRARQLLDHGEIGEVVQVEVRWNVETYDHKHGITTWKTDGALGGGALAHYGCHMLYYLEWFLGRIVGLSARLTSPGAYQHTGDTVAHVALEFASGAVGSAALSTVAPFGNGHSITFHGSDGALVISNPTHDPVRGFRLSVAVRGEDAFRTLAEETDTLAREQEDSRVGPVSRLAERFLGWIEAGTPAHPSFEDGRRVQALLDAAKRSHREGLWAAGLKNS